MGNYSFFFGLAVSKHALFVNNDITNTREYAIHKNAQNVEHQTPFLKPNPKQKSKV